MIEILKSHFTLQEENLGHLRDSSALRCPDCRRSHVPQLIEVIGPPHAKAQHALQLNLYRLLLQRNGIEVDQGELIDMDMDMQYRIPVDLLPLDQTERYLRERVALAVQPNLPLILTDDDEVWHCKFCPARNACEQQQAGPAPALARKCWPGRPQTHT